MNRSTMTLAAGGLAFGVLGAGAVWALLDGGESRSVAPITVTSVADRTLDPTLDPSLDPLAVPSPTDTPSPSSTGSGSTTAPTGPSTGPSAGAVAVPEGITQLAARQIALDARPGTVREIELDDENDRTVWKIDVNGTDGVRWEVSVDALTGTVLRNERD
ncbi:MAG: PepSY domain-containing protein [Kineosporiaceae bacterium]|nr:PepSY domain-containing protein [Kineosporiaceae bacterium]